MINATGSAGGEASASRRIGKRAEGFLVPKPYLITKFLPKCAQCGQRHPLAFQPPRAADVCPDCGAKAAPPETRLNESVAITGSGPHALLARFLFAVARFLSNLARRL